MLALGRTERSTPAPVSAILAETSGNLRQLGILQILPQHESIHPAIRLISPVFTGKIHVADAVFHARIKLLKNT